MLNSPHAGMRPHVREGMKHDIHIKLKSYKFELLGELVVVRYYTVFSFIVLLYCEYYECVYI